MPASVRMPHQSYTAWELCMSILHCMAMTIAVFRLWLRHRSGRMWWDDYFVILPMLVDFFYWITLLAVPPPGPTLESIINSSNYWLSLFPSLTVVWLSRICFLLLLTRLFPPGHIYRRITLALTGIFTLTYLTLFALSVPPCDGVHLIPPPSRLGEKNCKIPPKTTAKFVFWLTASFLSDLILIIWPLLMLYKVKLSRPQDRPVVAISLGCSVFTFLHILALTGLYYWPIIYDNNYHIIISMLEHVGASVSLIVCNMPVVACAAYRAFQRARDVPRGTTVQMPDASPFPNSAGLSGLASSSLPSSDSKETPTGDTRLTYDDLTRISMSFDTDEV